MLANGNPEIAGFSGNNNGLLYGTYALLEQLGFAFFHPLEPTLPPSLNFSSTDIQIEESPYWAFRGKAIPSSLNSHFLRISRAYTAPYRTCQSPQWIW